MSGTKAQGTAAVALGRDLIAAIDAEAGRSGESRSSVVRRAVERYLEERQSADIGRRIAEGYRRVPPGVPDEWGDLEAMTERSTVELLQRLDEEERQAGFDPW